MSIQVTGVVKVKQAGKPFTGTDKNGEPYSLRSLACSGQVNFGVDLSDIVDELELVCFKSGEKDVLWAGLDTLHRGDEIEVTFVMDWTWMLDNKQHRRLVLRPNRLVGCRVLVRSPNGAAVRGSAVPTFEDASA